MDGVAELVDRVVAGEPRAIGRMISWVEDGSPRLPEAMARVAARPGHAHVVGSHRATRVSASRR